MQVGLIPPAGHPTLLVQTVSAVLDGQGIELVPHLPTDDPLLTHMELVLQAASVAAGVAGRLYAEALADALAVHFLQRYAACRIARAQQLLAETDLPLSVIGLQVGWTDQSYFTVLFQKHVAMTPKAYRAATRRV